MRVAGKAGARTRPQILRPQQPQAVLSRGQTLLNNGFSSNSSVTIGPNQIIDNTANDGFYYVMYGAVGASSQWGLAKATSLNNLLAGTMTDLGALSGIPTGTGIWQARLLLTPDNKWSFYYVTGTGAHSGQLGLYQTAANAAINGTYSLVTSSLVPVSSTISDFDYGRVSEPHVFKTASATSLGSAGIWCILYMGFNNGNTIEQVGLAVSSGDHTGPYTKAAGNPVIPIAGTGFDSGVCADPWTIYYNGTYYIFYSAEPTGGATFAANAPVGCVTTTDFSTFTKRGISIPTGVAWANDCNTAFGGAPWWPGVESAGYTYSLPITQSIIYKPYLGRPRGAGNTGVTTWSFIGKLDAQGIFDGRILNGTPWVRLEAESSPSGQATTGSGWTNTTSTHGYSGTGFTSSATTNDTISLTKTCQRIRVYCVEANIYGIANISLDAVQVGTFDGGFNAPNEGTNNAVVLAYDTGDMPYGSHTVTLTVSGTKNSNATGTTVGVDCWEYVAVNPSPVHFPTTSVLDNFNRTENPLSDSSAWASTSIFGAGKVFKTTGATALSTQSDGTSVEQSWNTSFARPAEVALTVTTNQSGRQFSLWWLQSPTSASFTGYKVTFSSGTWTLNRFDATVQSGNLATGSFTLANGYKIGMRLEASGLITVYANDLTGWASLGSAIDATYTGSGYIGMQISGATAALDDFTGGVGS